MCSGRKDFSASLPRDLSALKRGNFPPSSIGVTQTPGAPSWLSCLPQHLLIAHLQRTLGSSWLSLDYLLILGSSWFSLDYLLRAGASSLALHHTRVLCYQVALIWGFKWIWNTLVCTKGDWAAGFSKEWESGEQQSSVSGNGTRQSSSLRDCLVLMESKAEWPGRDWWLCCRREQSTRGEKFLWDSNLQER